MHKIGELNNVCKICKTCYLERNKIALGMKKCSLNKKQEVFTSARTFEKHISKVNVFLVFLLP